MDAQQQQLALAAIRRHFLFSNFSESELEQMIKSVRLYELKAEQTLFYQEQPADHFFLLADGLVKLFRTAPDGNEKVIEIVSPGQTVAEAVMFMRRAQFPVSAQALKASRVYGIDCGVYYELLQHNVDACMRIMGDLSMRLHSRLNDVFNLTQQNATYRVVRFLASQLPSGAKDGCKFYLNSPKHVIASRLSVKPETFSRLMSTLAQKGVIEVKGREITILSLEQLHQFE
ncbi:Crp/Fnr family transcriptional regulator [Motiliproteus sp.]|uniref:Crp/Fnr family transcriptional regulator n=1 Tax=Motiliproteus sp. TaxID=1898955 RepID=UPI003BAB0288